jgi:murein DD-endopeptidase MepM/ murein hydrolase activator NlpD
MWKDKLTLMLIPGAKGILKQLHIPFGLIYLVVGVFLTLLISSTFFSAQFVTDKVDARALTQLQAENEKLKERFEQMRWYLAQVEDRYQDLSRKEIYLRSLFELPDIDEAERQLGIGGPIPEALATLSPTEQLAVVTEKEIDRLLTVSEFEIEKFSEVETALLEVKDRLSHTPAIWPSEGWLSRGFGHKYDPFTGFKQMHHGIDIANHRGTPIVATADGRIKSAGNNGGLGKTIIISHGYGIETRYGHLSEISVKQGQRVKRGEVIGLMGSTGYSTGPHLHYEVWQNGQAKNPMSYILNEM